MKTQDIEIPFESERTGRYRFFEILPGFLSWSVLIAPFVFSLISPSITALFIIAFMLIWFVRAIGLNVQVLKGWRTLQQHQKYDWQALINDIEQKEVQDDGIKKPKWHYENVARLQKKPTPLKPSDIVHAIIIPTHTDGREILEPTLKSIIDSTYDVSKAILVITYEERAGKEIEEQVEKLTKEYTHHFRHAFATKHPGDLPNEIKGKGPNATWGARRLQEYLEQEKIDPYNVMVTTFDADNRPHRNYFAALTYTVAMSTDPIHVS